tara:strand:+ start:9065 stop:10372 length:1308 start_codon:yes stop_codon:yes gene_type:complete
MADLQKYKNKRIAIYGMGITGFSAAKTFKKLNAKVFCWDDNKKIRKKIKSYNFKLDKFWLNQESMDNILISPGIDINKCKIKKFLTNNFKKVITDIDLFFELNKKALIISITGTNGKSTTCKILEKILKFAKYNVKTVGNIGNPILSSNKVSSKSVFILEVSSYQLQYSKLFRSKHAAILNISPDHLERHKNIKNYAKTKSKIFFAQKNTDYSYLNLKKRYSKFIKNVLKRQRVKSKLVSVKIRDTNPLFKKINNQYFNSVGNIENLAFAYSISKNLKISDKIIVEAINKFKGLPHRQEVVLSRKNFLCINDSKATSFDASLQSLSNYRNIYWIVGGLPKYRDKIYLRNIKHKIIKAYVIGKNTSFFKKQIKKSITYKISKNIKKALDDISRDLKLNKKSKKTILLSPAAASFDQFDNFENRGNYFKNLVIKKFA